MEFNWVKLPLFSDWDYKYDVSLDGNSYSIRLYYSTRTKIWSMDLLLEDQTPIVLGEALLPHKQMMSGRYKDLKGFFWLEPVSFNRNETVNNPEDLMKYYNFFYITN